MLSWYVSVKESPWGKLTALSSTQLHFCIDNIFSLPLWVSVVKGLRPLFVSDVGAATWEEACAGRRAPCLPDLPCRHSEVIKVPPSPTGAQRKHPPTSNQANPPIRASGEEGDLSTSSSQQREGRFQLKHSWELRKFKLKPRKHWTR